MSSCLITCVTATLALIAMPATGRGEHYGNLVTYLRLKGLVPPSSEPRTPPPGE